MRNVLEEFQSEKYGKRKPTILGLREHIFTGRYVHLSKVLSNYILNISITNLFCTFFYFSVSSLAWFMSNQETSFVTIGQRVLANPLKYVIYFDFDIEAFYPMHFFGIGIHLNWLSCQLITILCGQTFIPFAKLSPRGSIFISFQNYVTRQSC
jgi:hypothetical protein